MFWIGLIIGWFTAFPIAVLAFALAQIAKESDQILRKHRTK